MDSGSNPHQAVLDRGLFYPRIRKRCPENYQGRSTPVRLSTKEPQTDDTIIYQKRHFTGEFRFGTFSNYRMLLWASLSDLPIRALLADPMGDKPSGKGLIVYWSNSQTFKMRKTWARRKGKKWYDVLGSFNRAPCAGSSRGCIFTVELLDGLNSGIFQYISINLFQKVINLQ